MKFSLSDIPEEGLDLEFTWDEDVLAEALARHSADSGPVVSPAAIKGRIRLTISQGDLLLTGWVEGALLLQCSRCLEEFRLPAQVDLNLVLRPRPIEGAEGTEAAEEQEMDALSVDPEEIDPADIIIQELLLSAPMKPLCREDCAGLCPTCGAPRKAGPCSCPAEADVDPKWAVLAKLKGDPAL
jgi:uncharacterized protein